MGAARPSGCQCSNHAKKERKWTSPKQSEKQSCQAVDKQSLQRLSFRSFEKTWQFTPKFLLKLWVLMHSSNEQNQGPNKTKALSYSSAPL